MLDLFIAMIAGIVSFLSPCVLPLVPAYIGYMGGRVTNTVSAQVVAVGADGGEVKSKTLLSTRFSTFLHGVSFVAGFTFVFVTLGIIGNAFVQELGSTSTVEGLIGRIGGMVIILFGLHFMGVVPRIFAFLRRHNEILSNPATSLAVALAVTVMIAWGFTGTVSVWQTATYPAWTGITALVSFMALWLWMLSKNAFVQPATFWNNTLNGIDAAFYADTRRQMAARGDQGLSGSAIMGVVFGAGWTPCIGPTLGVAMTMAANGSDIPRAALLMTFYSLGLGIPFLITALMLDGAQGGLRRLKRHMQTIQAVSGAFLILVGVLIAGGDLQKLSDRITTQFGDFTYKLEECTVGVFEGDIGVGDFGPCMSGNGINDVLEGSGEDLTIAGITTNEGAAIEDLEVGLSVNNLAPDFQTVNTAGEAVSLSDFRGQHVLLNFWYTFCAPCRVEMPEFQEAFEANSELGFTILAVNREQSTDEITEFADELGLTFPLLLDESGDIQDLYNVQSYPTTLLIDEDGVISYVKLGALTVGEIETLVTDVIN